MILNILETVFWGAVVFMVAQANIQNTCSGIRCTLSWVVAALGVILKYVHLICRNTLHPSLRA
jgi:hypothetical protein